MKRKNDEFFEIFIFFHQDCIEKIFRKIILRQYFKKCEANNPKTPSIWNPKIHKMSIKNSKLPPNYPGATEETTFRESAWKVDLVKWVPFGLNPVSSKVLSLVLVWPMTFWYNNFEISTYFSRPRTDMASSSNWSSGDSLQLYFTDHRVIPD